MEFLTLTVLLIKKFEGVLVEGSSLFTLSGWVISLLSILFLVLPLLGAIAFYTLGERKCMAGIQRRRGPNITGFWGVLQPLADGLKLVLKEFFIPQRANPFLFTLAPQVTFVLSLLGWGVIPLAVLAVPAHLPLGVLFIAAISALAIYGIVLSGWASNSKYAFLGALRSVAQVISYELPLSFVLVGVALVGGSLALLPLVAGQSGLLFFFPLLPFVVVFFISVLAETNRAPFDLPEAEAEIVAGYNVEYSGILFALFFLGEYSNMILMGALLVCLFLGGWTPLLMCVGVGSFIVKLLVPLVLFIVVRAILPRLRYDQLMELGWKDLLPLTLGYLILLAGVTFAGDFPLAEIWGWGVGI
jgi:NADH-quinone oxidoreductase subunit H